MPRVPTIDLIKYTFINQGFDNPSTFPLVSCHMRVMCIYDEILKHIYACVTRRGKRPNPKQAALTKSWVWIGTYVPALSAAISLPLLSLADLELLAPGYVTKLWKNNNIPSAHDNCETSTGFPSAISKLLLTIVETIKTRPGGSIAGHEEYQGNPG